MSEFKRYRPEPFPMNVDSTGPSIELEQQLIAQAPPIEMRCAISFELLNPQVEIDDLIAEKLLSLQFHIARDTGKQLTPEELQQRIDQKLEEWKQSIRDSYKRVNWNYLARVPQYATKIEECKVPS